MMHGKSTQNLSVRELEAREHKQGAPEPFEWETRSSRLHEISPEIRQRLEGEQKIRIRIRLEGSLTQHGGTRPTLGFGVRLIYFLFVGIWFGFVWLALGVAFCLSLIGLPLGILMLRHTDKAFALW